MIPITDDQRSLRDTVRGILLDGRSGPAVRPATEHGGDYAEVWAWLNEQVGVAGLMIPPEFGGRGYHPVEQAVVLGEFGRVLLGTPHLSTAVLAAGALLESGDRVAQRELLPRIARDGVIASLAVPGGDFPRDNGTDTDDAAAAEGSSASGYRLHGGRYRVLDGHAARLLLVVARSADGTGLFAVAGDAPGVGRQPCRTADPTRRYTLLRFDGVPARSVGAPDAARTIVAGTVRRACLALAAEQAGGARRCLEMSVEYARTRHQFGRPIGGFQAVRHKCADMRLDAESAWAAVCHAALAEAAGAEERQWAVRLAKASCSEAYLRIATENLQVHGGTGYDRDHEAHLHHRRAQATQFMFGDPGHHRRAAAEHLAGYGALDSGA